MRNRPSATALRAAIRRAAHQYWDEPTVFADPYAVKLIAAVKNVRLSRVKPRWESPMATSLRALLAARAQFAEDVLADAVERDVRQYCILGAGLDTFACRNPHEALGLRVFEVDHPASQAWKMDILAKARLRSAAVFAPADFERLSLSKALETAGWDSGQPTLFSCLGVVSYLAGGTFTDILRFVRQLPAGSGIVFDFPALDRRLSLAERGLRGLVSLKLALQGEAARSRFDPAALSGWLHDLGFKVTMLDARDVNRRYFAARADRLAVSWRSGLVHASV